MKFRNQNVYKINTPIEIRYITKDNESGLTDLSFVVTQPNGTDRSPIFMSEIIPGIYKATFTPDSIGYWWTSVSSVSSPSNSETQTFFVYTNYNLDNSLNFVYVESNGTSIQASTIYLDKLVINLPIAGTYLIEWSYEVTNDTLNTSIISRVRDKTNNNLLGKDTKFIASNINAWRMNSGFVQISVIGSSNVAIQWKQDTVGNVKIRKARLKASFIS